MILRQRRQSGIYQIGICGARKSKKEREKLGAVGNRIVAALDQGIGPETAREKEDAYEAIFTKESHAGQGNLAKVFFSS